MSIKIFKSKTSVPRGLVGSFSLALFVLKRHSPFRYHDKNSGSELEVTKNVLPWKHELIVHGVHHFHVHPSDLI